MGARLGQRERERGGRGLDGGQDDTPLRAWVVYEDAGAGFELVDIVPAETTSFELPNAGTWAISAAARTGVESRGVLVEVL